MERFGIFELLDALSALPREGADQRAEAGQKTPAEEDRLWRAGGKTAHPPQREKAHPPTRPAAERRTTPPLTRPTEERRTILLPRPLKAF